MSAKARSGAARGDAPASRGQPSPAGLPAASQAQLRALADREHPHCLLCGTAAPAEARLVFSVLPDGAVTASVSCLEQLQGYPDRLHGGAIAAALDAAMTNALFARGLVGVTAALTLRFLAPVRLGEPARLRGAFAAARARPPYYLEASLEQAGRQVAWAKGTFLAQEPRRPAAAGRPA